MRTKRHQSLVEDCLRLSEEHSESGFVPVRSLAASLQAEVLFRPLLVEAMIAVNRSPKHGETNWRVLVDSERFGEEQSVYYSENSTNQLSSRLRNTIAHELLHTFAFSADGKMRDLPKHGVSKSKEIRLLENEAESLSSLLLVPYKALNELFSEGTDLDTVDILRIGIKRFGVSRFILINRLRNLAISDPERIRRRQCLENLAIGIGSWLSKGEFELSTWPMFLQFESNFLPDFINAALNENSRTFWKNRSIPNNDARLYTNRWDFETYEGTPKFPNIRKARFRISLEEGPHREGTRFFFVIRKIEDQDNSAKTVLADPLADYIKKNGL